MAEFVELVEACSPRLWGRGKFVDLMKRHESIQQGHSLDQWIVGEPLRLWWIETGGKRGQVKIKMSTLLNVLKAHHQDEEARDPKWPKNASQFSAELRRHKQDLKALGIQVEIPNGTFATWAACPTSS